jgi:HPt (histidine-containing phosphotransfer) domain-containing protein
MDHIEQPILDETLERMWAKFLPLMLDRISIIESICPPLAAGTHTVAQRSEANGAAHKLAGVLGTFGLTKGTILAREAEMIYSSESASGPVAAARLMKIAAQLREMVENRKRVPEMG